MFVALGRPWLKSQSDTFNRPRTRLQVRAADLVDCFHDLARLELHVHLEGTLTAGTVLEMNPVSSSTCSMKLSDGDLPNQIQSLKGVLGVKGVRTLSRSP